MKIFTKIINAMTKKEEIQKAVDRHRAELLDKLLKIVNAEVKDALNNFSNDTDPNDYVDYDSVDFSINHNNQVELDYVVIEFDSLLEEIESEIVDALEEAIRTELL